MSSFLSVLKATVGESVPGRRFTDISDEARETLCNPLTPIREWERACVNFFIEGDGVGSGRDDASSSRYLEYLVSRRSDGEAYVHDDFCMDFDKIFDTELHKKRIEAFATGLPSCLAEWLSYETWQGRTASYMTFHRELASFIEVLERCLTFLKFLACVVTVELYHVPRKLNALLGELGDGTPRVDGRGCDATVLKGTIDRAYEIYTSHYENDLQAANASTTSIPSDLLVSYHDALYNAARRSALLPSGMSISDGLVQQTSAALVAGGGFADVYEGRLLVTGQARAVAVALKVPRNFGAEEHVRKVHAEICKEALVWNLSRDRNVLPLLGVVVPPPWGVGTADRIILVTPWMKNGNLSRFLSSNPEVDKMRMIGGILSGLRFLHHERTPAVVHGDLRCDNVLVGDDGEPCIADFGLSRVEATQATLTGTSAARGSLRWQAPELLLPETYGGNGKHTTASDMYAFGLTCLEVFTGQAPFHDLSDVQAVLAISQGRKPKRPEGGGRIPDWMWRLMQDCWCANAKARLRANETPFCTIYRDPS